MSLQQEFDNLFDRAQATFEVDEDGCTRYGAGFSYLVVADELVRHDSTITPKVGLKTYREIFIYAAIEASALWRQDALKTKDVDTKELYFKCARKCLLLSFRGSAFKATPV